MAGTGKPSRTAQGVLAQRAVLADVGASLLVVDRTSLPLLPKLLWDIDRALTVVSPELADFGDLPSALPRHRFVGSRRLSNGIHFVFSPHGDSDAVAYLLFTSGTTGEPKGVTYTHRASFLHTLRNLQADTMAITARDSVLAVVPMFHANAWGVPFAVPAAGAKLVLPGRHVDGASLAALINGEQERVRAIAGMKSYLSSAAVTMGEECIHLHGAMGTTDELPVGHAHKRLLVLATLFGDADYELSRFVALADEPTAPLVKDESIYRAAAPSRRS